MVFPVRLRVFLEGGDSFPAFDPDSEGRDYPSMTPAQLAAEFARYRTENLALLDRVTPDHLDRTAIHSELGLVTPGRDAQRMGGPRPQPHHPGRARHHAALHSRLRPWRFYFKDHDLGNE